MSDHTATIAWHLSPATRFDYDTFDRAHEWTFAGGEVVQASASPDFLGSTNRVNPDDAVIAATSSCHMLTFLAIAAKKGLTVLSYVDQPVGTVEKDGQGRIAITHIELRPKAVFDGDIDSDTLHGLHDSAHRHCFITNSLRSEVAVRPQR